MKHTGMGAVALFFGASMFCSCVSNQNAKNQTALEMQSLDSLSDEELLALAESGSARAMTRLAVHYQAGRVAGVSEDEAITNAIYWWEKAFAGGETQALVNIGLLYEHKAIPGGGSAYGSIPLDYEKAAEYFERATEAGDMKAPRQLGLLYKTGEGSFPKDSVKATGLFKLALERGDSTGTLLYADALYDGDGVQKDEKAAAALYTKLVKENAHDKEPASLRLRGIRSCGTIAESFGDGEKVSRITLTYAKNLDADSVSEESFIVADRKIESVSVDGASVTIALAYENWWETDGRNGQMPPRDDDKKEASGAEAGQGAGPRFEDDGTPVDLTARVTQIRAVRATDGTVFKGSKTAFTVQNERELVIENFTKYYFTDSETGISLPYFVYLPSDYDSEKKYPLVFFVPDASADTSIENATLTQGNGATIWATEEEQKKHPAIVVAVQYPYSVVKEYGALTTDEYTWTKGLTAVDNLLHFVIKEYAVDESRIYGTGQSQGCMTNIALSDKHPELFAAQFLVAGQWNVDEMAQMKDKKLWIVVCEGDTKAYPLMSSACALWEKLGSKVAYGDDFWNPKAGKEEMQENVLAMLKKDADIRMNVFSGGSHMYTWTLAYNIEGIRDWLFSQKK